MINAVRKSIRLAFLIVLIAGIIYVYLKILPLGKGRNGNTLDFNSPQILTIREYKKIDDQLTSIVEKKKPRAALSLLTQEAKKNNALAASCHILAHDIGHAAFKKYHNFGEAMLYQNEVCNSGYMHGVIESDFSQSKDLSAEMSTICRQYQPDSFA